MPVSEFIRVPVAAGNNIREADGKVAKTIKESTAILAKQPGFHSLRYGTSEESPEILDIAVEWDALSSHKNFQAGADFAPFLALIEQVIAGAPVMFHVDFGTATDQKETALSSPVTEVITLYFDGGPPADYLDEVHKAGAAIRATEEAKKFNLRGVAFGITEESDMEKDGVKGHAAICVVGWDSVQQHQDFAKTDALKLGAPMQSGVKGVELKHVFWQKVA